MTSIIQRAFILPLLVMPTSSASSRAKRNYSTKITTTRADGSDVNSTTTTANNDNNIKPSITRTRTTTASIECEHFDVCSGCTIKENFIENSESIQKAKTFFFESEPKLDFDIHLGNVMKYRNKVKLACRNNLEGRIDFGLFAKGSHQIVPIPNCAVHHPSINLYAKILLVVLRELDIRAYGEDDSTGELRYVQFVAPDYLKQISSCQITLVWNAKEISDRCALVCEKFITACEKLMPAGAGIHPPSVYVNLNDSKVNTIFESNNFHLVSKGDEFIYGNGIAYGPGSFMQANLKEHLQTLRDVVKELENCSSNKNRRLRVLDLFAGSGAIGFWLAKQKNLCVESIQFVEISPDIEKSWTRTKNSFFVNGDEDDCMSNCDIKLDLHIAPADDVLKYVKNECDVVVVNPPRKGVGRKVLQALCAKDCEADVLIYISCNIKSFIADYNVLVNGDNKNDHQVTHDGNKWKLRTAKGYVYFPGSDHIETMAVFDKISTSSFSC